MALVGFLDGTDERIVSTVETIQRRLMADGLVARYAADEENVDVDGLPQRIATQREDGEAV